MSHAYSEDQRGKKPAIGLFAALGWQTVSVLEKASAPVGRCDGDGVWELKPAGGNDIPANLLLF